MRLSREVPHLISYGLKMYLLVVDSPLPKPVLVMAKLGRTQTFKVPKYKFNEFEVNVK